MTKMPVVRIEDLARAMILELAGEDADIPIEVIGAKPGEKLYEELMNDEETRRTFELDRYFVVLPAFKSVYESIEYRYPGVGKLGVDKPYNSANEQPMKLDELRSYLRENGLLD